MNRAAWLFLLTLSLGTGLPAEATNWGPWQAPATSSLQATGSNQPLQQTVRWFQKFLSPIDGPRCPMYPTCSAYSLQALHKHGPAIGTFLTVDRLYREADPHEHDQPVNKWRRVRFFDPLQENDFWLSRET